MTETVSIEEDETTAPATPAWRSPIVLAVAAVAMLLIGAAAGMLATLSATEESTPGADSVDVGFAHDMSTHHYQAVSIASWTRDHTEDLAVQQLALDIENTQTGQIGRMTGWLQLWGQPELPETTERMKWMTGDGGGEHHADHADGGGTTTMPGMATPQELAKLRSLSGRELDVYFLQLMTRHHEGGLGMAEYAATRASHPAVRGLAERMKAGQQGEIKTMTAMLAERGATPLPATN
jgi:uncharacterized protein (DUF305 family)